MFKDASKNLINYKALEQEAMMEEAIASAELAGADMTKQTCEACEFIKLGKSNLKHTCGKDMPKEKTDFIKKVLKEFNEEFYESHNWQEVNDHIIDLLAEQKQELKKEFFEVIEFEFKKAKKQAIKEYLKTDEGKCYTDYETLKKMAREDIKQELLDKLPKEISEIEHYKHLGTEVQAYDEGFNDCLEEIANQIKSL
jgi:hypothetical protein